MSKFFATLLLLSAVGSFCFAQTIKRIDGTTLTFDQLTLKITQLMTDAHVSGAGVSVFNNNKPVFSKTFGFADVPQQKPFQPSTVIYGASFSKAIFAYIVAQLVQEKVIDLDKPLVQYLSKPLPDYKIPGWNRGYQHIKDDKRYEKITARICLDHSTGFPNWRWFEADKKLKIKFDPGTRYSYSGEGLYLLQFVIEQITGKDYETIARERVFIPFGMPNTSYVWQEKFAANLGLGHNAAGKPYELMKWKEAGCSGTLSTTVEDYTRFFAALMQGKGLSKATFNQMISPQISIRSIKQFGPGAWRDSTLNDSIKLGYGLGVGVFQTPYGRAFFKEGHDDGWGHYCIAFPDQKTGIVIMTNNDTGESLFKELLAFAIGDKYTPWLWEDYIPYNAKN